MTDDKPLPRIPPPWVPLAELAGWLQEMHGLTASEMRDVLVDLRAIPLPFRLLDGSSDENTPLESWEDLEVENEDWWAGRARWKQCPGSSYFPLVVSWDAVTSAVNRSRKRQERLALQPPAGGDAHPAEAQPRAPRPAYSPEALAAWFVLRVGTWSRDVRPPTEVQCLKAAGDFFEDSMPRGGQTRKTRIPRDEFRKIRRAKTPDNWRKRGPPSGR